MGLTVQRKRYWIFWVQFHLRHLPCFRLEKGVRNWMSWESIGILAAAVAAVAGLFAALFAAFSWWEARKGVTLQKQSSEAELRNRAELVKGWLSDAKYVLENPPTAGFDLGPPTDFHLSDISNALAQEGLFEGVVRDAIEDARKALIDADRLIQQYRIRDVVLSTKFIDCFTPVKNEAIWALDKALKYLD